MLDMRDTSLNVVHSLWEALLSHGVPENKIHTNSGVLIVDVGASTFDVYAYYVGNGKQEVSVTLYYGNDGLGGVLWEEEVGVFKATPSGLTKILNCILNYREADI